MAHYGTLRDYQFSEDVDDIRGADLYTAGGGKIGTVKDVIFDHDNGAIRYVVADLGHDRRVLIASDQLFRSITDEDSFETNLTPEQAATLPVYDEKMLESEKDWKKHEEEHRKRWHELEEKFQAEYKEKWHDAPVQHRHGSDRNITPEIPANEAAGGGERIVTGADLTPHRIAGKFPGISPMVVPGSPNASEPTLRPAGTTERAENAAWGNVAPGPRWSAFQEHLRGSLPELRRTCSMCPGGTRKVA